jgi:predicted molibdopterin-dependent oxidoreductase YjgC
VRVDVRVDRILRQMSQANESIDDGWLCDRGRWGFDAVNSQERLLTPLVRKNGQLEPATWDEALDLVAARLQEIARRDGPDAIGGIGSTHTTNEEAYLFQKLLRAALGTNNVDNHHGLSPASASAPSATAAATPSQLPWVWSDSIAGLEKASHIVLFAANPYERQPVIDLRIKKALRAGAKIYVVSDRPTRLDRLAALKLTYKPGQLGTAVQLLLCLLASQNMTRGSFSDSPVLLEHLRQVVSGVGSVEAAAQQAVVDAGALGVLAREIAGAKGAVLLYDEMATREEGAATLPSDLLTLALATDNVGRRGAGVGPLFEDNNSLGARDMGLLPDSLPGYASLQDKAMQARLRRIWGEDAPKNPGLNYEQMLDGGVKALYVMGANPARHMPDAAALAGLEFLVVQALSLNETAQYADVVLPAQSYAEKEGTFTNTERCVQAVHQAMRPLAGPRADWQILMALAERLGQEWRYASPRAILDEIASVAPIYSGLSWDVVSKSQGIRWPALPENVAEGGSPFLSGEVIQHGLPTVVEVAETTAAGD